MCRPKKQSTPRRRARKNEEDSSLRFFIFETLSQRFLRNIFIDFRFFEKNKNAKIVFFAHMSGLIVALPPTEELNEGLRL